MNTTKKNSQLPPRRASGTLPVSSPLPTPHQHLNMPLCLLLAAGSSHTRKNPYNWKPKAVPMRVRTRIASSPALQRHFLSPPPQSTTVSTQPKRQVFGKKVAARTPPPLTVASAPRGSSASIQSASLPSQTQGTAWGLSNFPTYHEGHTAPSRIAVSNSQTREPQPQPQRSKESLLHATAAIAPSSTSTPSLLRKKASARSSAPVARQSCTLLVCCYYLSLIFLSQFLF